MIFDEFSIKFHNYYASAWVPHRVDVMCYLYQAKRARRRGLCAPRHSGLSLHGGMWATFQVHAQLLQPTQKSKAILAYPTIKRFLIHYFAF